MHRESTYLAQLASCKAACDQEIRLSTDRRSRELNSALASVVVGAALAFDKLAINYIPDDVEPFTLVGFAFAVGGWFNNRATAREHDMKANSYAQLAAVYAEDKGQRTPTWAFKIINS